MNEEEEEEEEEGERRTKEEDGLDESILELVKLITGEMGVDILGCSGFPLSIGWHSKSPP